MASQEILECETLDSKELESKWYELDLLALPDEFDWKRLGKRYLKKVKAIIRESPELRNVLDSENLEAIKDNTQESAGIIPDFNLSQYQEGIRDRPETLAIVKKCATSDPSSSVRGAAQQELTRGWKIALKP